MDTRPLLPAAERDALLALWAVPGIGSVGLGGMRRWAAGRWADLLDTPARDWVDDLPASDIVRARIRAAGSLRAVADEVRERACRGRMEVLHPGDPGYPERLTEVRLLLRHTPALPFLPSAANVEANQIVLRIDPDPGLRLHLAGRDDQTWRSLYLDDLFAQDLGEPAEPYERLLHTALSGDHQLFAREDGVEETWRIVQPLLDEPPEIHSYKPGSWGPAAANRLLRGHARWQKPWEV